MRRFIVIGHEAPIDPAFSLDDLPGSAGRLDILCRCVVAALLRSHGVRADAEIITLHQDTVAIRFDGEAISRLNPDERSTAARFRQALEARSRAVGRMEVEVAPGLFVAHRDLEAVLAECPGAVIQLHPQGDAVTGLPTSRDVTFVLSDHHSFSQSDQQHLDRVIDRRISLGPVPIHADQAITVVHNYLDTDGYRQYTSTSSHT